jgi:hypothetical protein
MLGALIGAERNRDGLWLEDVDPATGKVVGRGRRVVDTWGYLTNAFVMADLADAGAASPPRDEGRHSDGRFAPEVERVMRSVSLARDVPWEPDMPHDGYADAIESMLCLLPFRPVQGAAEWIDDEIARLLDQQHRDGFVGRQYLDGNFVRSAMLYAEWKTRGARLEPWRDDVWIGGAGDGPTGNHLRLHLSADTAWSGRLCLDAARHRTHWNMKTEYPRRNGSPEWFTVEDGRAYAVRDIDTGTATTHDGAELIVGIPLALEPGRARRLVVEPL